MRPGGTGQMVNTPGGGYPASMNSLVDANGRISLHRSDYAGYSRDEIMNFLAAQPYESNAIFSPDGRLLYITSQFNDDSVGISAFVVKTAVVQDGSTDGRGYEDVHNHPITPGAIAIFSPKDIGAYMYNVELHYAFGTALPNTFSVQTSNGEKFTLKYVGGGSNSFENFRGAYTRTLNKAIKEAHQIYAPGADPSKRAYITKQTDNWLKSKARDYGFEYTSNIYD